MASGTNSKNRFFNIHIWDEPWFVDLGSTEKLFWIYMNSKCDNIGLYAHSKRRTEFDIQSPINADDIENIYNKSDTKVTRINADKFLILGFCKFQHCRKSPLLPVAKVFVSYMKDIRDAGLVEYFAKNQPNVVSKDTYAFFKAFESGILDFKDYSKRKKSLNTGSTTEYLEALSTAKRELSLISSQCHNNGMPMIPPFHQGRGKEAGNGVGTGLGKKLGEGTSSYALSKAIAERIDSSCTHELVKEVQSLAARIQTKTGDQNPYNTISIMHERLCEHTPSGVSISMIEHEIEKLFPNEFQLTQIINDI